MMDRNLRRNVLLSLGVALGTLALARPASAEEALVITGSGTRSETGDVNFINTTSHSSGISFDDNTGMSQEYTVESQNGSITAKGTLFGISVNEGKTLSVIANKAMIASTGTQYWQDANATTHYPTGMNVIAGTAHISTEAGTEISGYNFGLSVNGADVTDNPIGGDPFPADPTRPGATMTLATQGDNVIKATSEAPYEEIVAVTLKDGVNFTLDAGGSNQLSAATITQYHDYPSSYALDINGFGTATLTAGKENLLSGGDVGLQASGFVSIYWDQMDPGSPDPTHSGELPNVDFAHSDIVMMAGGNNEITGGQSGLDISNGTTATLTAGVSNSIKGGTFGARVDYRARLDMNGNNTLESNGFTLWSSGKADVTLDAKGGISSITATEAQSGSDGGNQDMASLRPVAVTATTGGYVTLKNGTLSIKGPTALAAAHTYYQACANEDFNPWIYSGSVDPLIPSDPGTGGWSDDSGNDIHYAAPYNASGISLYAYRAAYTRDKTDRASVITASYGAGSTIEGDITAYDQGTVRLTPEDGGTIDITGNVYATNNVFAVGDWQMYSNEQLQSSNPEDMKGGTVELELANGSTLTGFSETGLMAERSYIAQGNTATITDPYTGNESPMSDEEWLAHTPEIGTYNLTLNDGSTWNMTSHSTVTNLTGRGGNVVFQNGGDGLEIETLSGSNTYAMDLDAKNGANSDMLYVVNGGGTQTLRIKNLSTLDSQMDSGDAVRFATIKNSQNEFQDGSLVAAFPNGLYNNNYKVEYRTVSTDPLNTDAYNNAYNGPELSADNPMARKPSTSVVNEMYVDDDAQNVYVVKSRSLNDGAKAPGQVRDLVWRSQTDLDTFTNRTGQSLYFTPGADQGAWIRLKYRNLGIDGAGELDGNTYELGYTTVLNDTDRQKHRFSVSAAYGKNSGSWEGLSGDLELRDAAIALYDTREYFPNSEDMAGKPAWKEGTHSYWDTYLKYHHTKTEYKTIDRSTGLRYDGDYDQNVFNLSTEYGRENKLDQNWSLVPQAQLQLSYLGSYDYTDSQGIDVSGDHDWSLIGRLGFDLVKKMDPKLDSKIYFKASLLHEFMDGNDVTLDALGSTIRSDGDQSGTWGVVGLGYSARIGQDQYFYRDAERYFGHDFTRTYNVRAGVNWKF